MAPPGPLLLVLTVAVPALSAGYRTSNSREDVKYPLFNRLFAPQNTISSPDGSRYSADLIPQASAESEPYDLDTSKGRQYEVVPLTKHHYRSTAHANHQYDTAASASHEYDVGTPDDDWVKIEPAHQRRFGLKFGQADDWSGGMPIADDWSGDRLPPTDWSRLEHRQDDLIKPSWFQEDWLGRQRDAEEWARPEPDTADWSESEQSPDDRSQFEPDRTDWSQSEPDNRDWSQSEPNSRDWSQSEPDNRDWSQSEPDNRDRSQPEPDYRDWSQSEPNSRDWSQSEPNSRDRSQSERDQHDWHDPEPGTSGRPVRVQTQDTWPDSDQRAAPPWQASRPSLAGDEPSALVPAEHEAGRTTSGAVTLPQDGAAGRRPDMLDAQQTFLLQTKRQPGVQQPHAAALRAQPRTPHWASLRTRKRMAGSSAPQQRYMPWMMIVSISVGTVGTVLAAIFVVRRVKGGPGKMVTQQWIPHHVLRMSTGSADIQPTGLRSGDGASEPIRIKAKGLLERRCSSSSLTISLQQTDDDGEPVVVSSPTRQCEAAEYLASAGNRLSRRELRLTETSVADLQAEFWDIPLNFPDKCDIVGAGTKNRYKAVVPNEHTRVTLTGVNEDPLSCYINANWIRGYDNEERAYIATQGPLSHTLEDFWELVLSRRAPALVMITKLRENGRIKCAGYLPETRQKAVFGKIEVTVKRILPRNGYTLRHVSVKRGKEHLQLQHFWFTAWPDHRTPEDSHQLLQMAAEVETARRDAEGNPTGPVVVHCSAGIGRTGCFIAISIGTSQLMEEGGVDVLGIVCSMRQDRGGMVQTAEQYIFIHRALRVFEATLPSLETSDRRAN